MGRVRLGIVGDKELLKRLDVLEPKLRRRVLRTAVSKASRLVLREAKSLAPVRTGALRRALAFKVKTYRSGVVVGVVGVDRKVVFQGRDRFGRPVKIWPVKYAHLVNSGAKPHPVPWGRKPLFRKRPLVMHPGAPATRFFDRAVETTASPAVDVMAREIAAGLEKHL